jgi:hypothetical protein
MSAANVNLQIEYQKKGFSGGNEPTPKWLLVLLGVLVLAFIAYGIGITTGVL